MLSDLKLLFFLKKRQLKRSSSRFAFFFLGSDLMLETDKDDRVYQVYMLLIWLAVIAMLWFALLDAVEKFFMAQGASFALATFPLYVMIPLFLFVSMGIAYIVSSPFKFSQPDIDYLLLTPISLSALFVVQVLPSLCILALLGLGLGFLYAAGISAGTAISFSLFLPALQMGFLFVGIGLLAWYCAVHKAGRKRISRKQRVLMVIALLLIGSIGSGIVAFSTFSEGMLLAYFTQYQLLLCVGTAILDLLLFCGLLVLSKRIKVSVLADESGLYAETYTIREMQIYNFEGYNEIIRKKKLARKGARIYIPLGAGKRTLITRAVLSHLRQIPALFNVVGWGMVIAPVGAFLLVSNEGFMLWMLWLQILLFMSQGVREITRVYRDEMKNRSYRNCLPFSAFQLFIYSILPSFVLCLVVSVLTCVCMLPSGLLFEGMLIAIMIDAILILFAGLEYSVDSFSKRTPTYEGYALSFALLSIALSFVAPPLVIAVLFAVIAIALVFFFRKTEA